MDDVETRFDWQLCGKPFLKAFHLAGCPFDQDLDAIQAIRDRPWQLQF